MRSSSSRSDAQIQILHQIQPQFQLIDSRTSTQTIEKITQPILKIQALNPKLENRPKEKILWQMSLLFGFLSFLISVSLHLTYSHFLLKWAKLHRRFPFQITHEGRKIKTKPVQVLAINDCEYLQEHSEHPLHKCSLVLPLEIKNGFDTQQENDSTRVRTPYTFLRDYIKRLKRSEEPTLTIEHINRPPSHFNKFTLIYQNMHNQNYQPITGRTLSEP